MLRGRGVRRSLACAAVVGALLLAGGCTGDAAKDPDPTTTPSQRATASPTPTPTPTEAVDVTVAPPRPPAMDAPPTADGAVAVAEYFLQLLPYVNATGDLSEWMALSHPDCIFCASVTKDVRSQVTAGTRDEGGAIAVTHPGATEVTPGAFYQVDALLHQAPSRSVDGSGAVLDTFDGSDAHVSVAVVWDGQAWAIRGVETHPVAS